MESTLQDLKGHQVALEEFADLNNESEYIQQTIESQNRASIELELAKRISGLFVNIACPTDWDNILQPQEIQSEERILIPDSNSNTSTPLLGKHLISESQESDSGERQNVKRARIDIGHDEAIHSEMSIQSNALLDIIQTTPKIQKSIESSMLFGSSNSNNLQDPSDKIEMVESFQQPIQKTSDPNSTNNSSSTPSLLNEITFIIPHSSSTSQRHGTQDTVSISSQCN